MDVGLIGLHILVNSLEKLQKLFFRKHVYLLNSIVMIHLLGLSGLGGDDSRELNRCHFETWLPNSSKYVKYTPRKYI